MRLVAHQRHHLLLLVIVEQLPILEQIEEPHHSRQRRPQFVTDRGDDTALLELDLAPLLGDHRQLPSEHEQEG